MSAPDPAVADVRRAVRESLADVAPGRRVLVACSGGADSMALAAAAGFEGRKAGWRVEAVVVDHGLQQGSAEVAAAVAERLRTLSPYEGLESVEVVRVEVAQQGGPEAAARTARYAALDAAAAGDAVVLLGHTRDDQAETVLLGLVRGSGTRSLAGMPARAGRYRRPLLAISREQTVRACRALDVPVWDDPHNADRRFVRSRIRHEVLPFLEKELGSGVAEGLVRTARLAGADADLLERLAAELAEGAGLATAAWSTAGEVSLQIAVLADAPAALRWRVLRLAAIAAGSPAGELFASHVASLDDLVLRWHGQRFVTLPGHVVARRRGPEIHLERRGC
jgi:tRNA(Ile)-lysidine synthase